MRLPIRVQLTLSFSLLLLAGVGAFAAFLYYRYDCTLEQVLRNDLVHEATEVELLLARARDRAFVRRFLAQISRPIESENAFFVRVLDGEGRTLLAGPTSPPPLPVPEAVWSGKEREHLTQEAPGGLWIYTRRLPAGLSSVFPAARFLQVAEPGEVMQERLARFQLNALLLAAALFVFAVPAGLLLTRAALRPVERITWHAATIGATDLSRRLPLRGTGDELDRLVGVLNETFARLERALARNRRFAAGAAHQLRTPLARLQGELELLAREAREPQLAARLERIRGDVERLQALCRRLLLLTKVEERAGPASRKGWRPVDLTHLVGDLCLGLGSRARRKGLKLEVTSPERAVLVHGDPELLGEALYNLLDNALTYTPAGGRVTVHLAVGDGEARVSVADTGPGLPAEAIRRFEAGDAGGGLGLLIARGIARHHGGRLELVRTAPGAEWLLTLPILSSAPQPAPLPFPR